MNDDNRFAAYTRSQSFALTMSAPQIDRLLGLVKMRELMAKYSWYRPYEANFGTADQLATEWCDSTIRSLTRKGLVDVTPREPSVCQCEVIVPTLAGELMAMLLIEADFGSPRIPLVNLHPDDRAVLRATGTDFEFVPGTGEHDRRDPADAPFLAFFSRTKARS